MSQRQHRAYVAACVAMVALTVVTFGWLIPTLMGGVS